MFRQITIGVLLAFSSAGAQRTDPQKRVPESVRAGVISLAIWVDKHSRKALKREADLQPLVEVNRNIMEGLSGG